MRVGYGIDMDVKFVRALSIGIISVLAACTVQSTPMNTLVTIDGVTIASDFKKPEGAKTAVLFLHMMPATRTSFVPLAKALADKGIASLAIDLRGHGESLVRSIPGGDEEKLDYQKFTDKEHQSSRLDVDAAMNFLKAQGFQEEGISFVGASIGANLSIDALSRYNKTQKAVLLSAGLDYRGVETEPAMRRISTHQKVWIIAAEGDSYSAQSALPLQQLKPDQATMTIYGGSEHGTNLFQSEPTLLGEIVKFLSVVK